VAEQMKDVRERILKNDSGSDTQKMQQQIVDRLQRLIDDARKQGRQQQTEKQPQEVGPRTPIGQPDLNPKPKPGGTGPDNRNPTQSSNDPRQGKAEKAKVDQMRRGLEEQSWANLPAHDREQMLQLPREEFLPKYELLIEDYFRRLADEKTGPEEER
jgi:hypothetical protein